MDLSIVVKIKVSVAAFIVAVTCIIACIRKMKERTYRRYESTLIKARDRMSHMDRVLYGGKDNCVSYIRMDVSAFFKLARLLRNERLLVDTIHVSIEEQLMTFLHILGHNEKNRNLKIGFARSRATVSKYFNRVLWAIFQLRSRFIQQACGETHSYIASNRNFYPYFKDCIGFIDGTHITATVPANLVARFRGRKGVTQNVLAAVTPDLAFTYVLAGWEGGAHDFTVLRDALSRPPLSRLRVIPGKYYLCDAGYTTMPGFIAPYRGVRYHLKEQQGRTPRNMKELFNFRHASLRSCIERAFGVLKNRFKILQDRSYFSLETQVDLVLVCCILHNFILRVDPQDSILNETEIDEEVDVVDITSSQSRTQREQREENRQWLELRDKIANDMWNDYCNR